MVVANVWKYTGWLVKCVETSIRHVSAVGAVAPAGGSACALNEVVTGCHSHSDRMAANRSERSHVFVRGRCSG